MRTESPLSNNSGVMKEMMRRKRTLKNGWEIYPLDNFRKLGHLDPLCRIRILKLSFYVNLKDRILQDCCSKTYYPITVAGQEKQEANIRHE